VSTVAPSAAGDGAGVAGVPRLAVEGLSAGYDRIQVLHGVDLRVAPGELLAVVGANGAGKTTLLRVVSGLLPARAGRVLLDGRPVTGTAPERLAGAGVAHVPENRLVFPGMSVLDNLALGAYARRRDGAERTEETRRFVLDLFPRLADRQQQSAGTLSGGEQQMLAIGRGLMARPTLLLLDEPSLGLAPKLVSEIFAVLGRLRDEGGMAFVLVEQNARAALRIADRAVVLDRGRVSLEGTPEQLLEDPRVQAAYLGRGYSEVTT
jgi:branched-chain amino acid transport system ATP-binding protein